MRQTWYFFILYIVYLIFIIKLTYIHTDYNFLHVQKLPKLQLSKQAIHLPSTCRSHGLVQTILFNSNCHTPFRFLILTFFFFISNLMLSTMSKWKKKKNYSTDLSLRFWLNNKKNSKSDFYIKKSYWFCFTSFFVEKKKRNVH